MQEICADQTFLEQRKFVVIGKRVFHFPRPRLECRKQVVMPTVKIFEDIGEHKFCCFRTHAQDAIDDMISAGFVGWIEVAWLHSGLERTYDDPRRIRAKVKCLTIQK